MAAESYVEEREALRRAWAAALEWFGREFPTYRQAFTGIEDAARLGFMSVRPGGTSRQREQLARIAILNAVRVAEDRPAGAAR